MFSLIVILILFVNVLNIIWNKYKIKIVDIIIFIGLSIFLYTVRNTPDINNYMITYYSENYSYKDVGFKLICKYCVGLGLDYYQFQFIYYMISLSLVIASLLNLTDSRTIIYVCYIAYPFLFNVIQIRNFFFAAMLLSAYSLCITTKYKERRLLYWIICLLVASTQHISAIAFLPFAFLMEKKKVLRILAQVMLIVAIILVVIPNNAILNLITAVLKVFIDESRASKYTIRITHFGFVVMIGESLLMITIVWLIKNKERTLFRKRESFNSKIDYSFELAENLMIYSCAFCPLYTINGNFTRLMQNETLILYYVVFTFASELNKGHKIDHSYRLVVDRPIVIFLILFLRNVYLLWVKYADIITMVLEG